MSERAWSAALIGGALLLGLALVGGGVATMRAVEAASATLIRGQADVLHDEIGIALGRGVPTAEELSGLVAEFADADLLYIAITDRTGDIVAEAGTAAITATPSQDFAQGPNMPRLVRVGDRVRAHYRRGLRRRLAEVLGTPAPTLLVFEFVPRQAYALERRARRGVLFAWLGAATELALVGLYLRQRKRAERAQRREEQSRRLAALGQMSAVLAHELRNPLASLKGHAQLLERALPAGEPPRGKAELVVSEAQRLERLVTDLLGFVRTGELKRASTDLAALASAVAEDRSAERILVAGKATSLSVDADRLRQVLANLVDNALQSGDGIVEIVINDRPGEVEIAVRDHGPGIAPADLPRLFEPFFTTRTQGTGLGLAIARHIVELHGGTLTAANAQGGGARFSIVLPRGEALNVTSV
jgi:two-component system sensor histidine kinase HydH